jgi:DNA-binding SARP family transcriptional activator
VQLPTRKAEALLAVLASRDGVPQRRGCLAALLWSGRDDAQARHSLSQALSAIRGAFADAPALLVTRRDSVGLDPAVAAVDSVAFQRLVAGDAVEDLERAAALYRGPLLDGFALRAPAFEDWLLLERARLRELAIGALLGIARRRSERGEPATASAALERALALDPLAEETYRWLIRLELERGCPNSAIRRYRQCAEILMRELDTVPEPATSALYHEALARLRAPGEKHRQFLYSDPNRRGC